MRARSSRRGWLFGALAVVSAVAGCGADDAGRSSFGVAAACDTPLTAIVASRRQTSFLLSWTAPIGASSYQVRYAKVPITYTNFDDTTVTTAVTFSGSPATPGATDSMTISNLYIETGYYFAVAARNSAGAYNWLQTTGTAATAHFNRTAFASSSGTNEELGYSIASSADVNGDGLSDILAGTFNGGKAYLYLGSATMTAHAADVVLSGTTSGFGNTVAMIGDVDNDGRQDIAVSDIANPPKVYVYKGRASWPATLSAAQADYVISGDSTYATSALGAAITALGDFTGDGIDDFAVGARSMNTTVGRVVIIPGKSSGFASVTLPDTTNAIIIDGDATLGKPAFGYRVMGLGHFYTATTGTTLLVAAPGVASNPTSSAGRVYAFHGQTGSSGAISVTAADHVTVGPATGTRIGLVLSNLGPLLGSTNAVGVGNMADTVDVSGMSGVGYVLSGTPSTGPFNSKKIMSLGGGSGNGAVMGGGLPGRDTALSLLGDSTPDLVFGSEQSSVLTIFDGAKLSAKTSPVEATASAEVQISLPSGWTTGDGSASVIPDMDGDGFPDLCVGNAFGAVPGAVAV
jgi:hypothetical protein